MDLDTPSPLSGAVRSFHEYPTTPWEILQATVPCPGQNLHRSSWIRGSTIIQSLCSSIMAWASPGGLSSVFPPANSSSWVFFNRHLLRAQQANQVNAAQVLPHLTSASIMFMVFTAGVLRVGPSGSSGWSSAGKGKFISLLNAAVLEWVVIFVCSLTREFRSNKITLVDQSHGLQLKTVCCCLSTFLAVKDTRRTLGLTSSDRLQTKILFNQSCSSCLLYVQFN